MVSARRVQWTFGVLTCRCQAESRTVIHRGDAEIAEEIRSRALSGSRLSGLCVSAVGKKLFTMEELLL